MQCLPVCTWLVFVINYGMIFKHWGLVTSSWSHSVSVMVGFSYMSFWSCNQFSMYSTIWYCILSWGLIISWLINNPKTPLNCKRLKNRIILWFTLIYLQYYDTVRCFVFFINSVFYFNWVLGSANSLIYLERLAVIMVDDGNDKLNSAWGNS